MRPKGRLPAWLSGLAGCALAAAAASPVHAQEDSWSGASPLPTPRRLLAAAVSGGKLYTFGGCGSPCFSPPLHTSTLEETRVEVFDPATGGWSVPAPMPTVLFGAAAAAPGDGRLYTLGGYVSGNVLQQYDPVTGAWSLKAPLPTPRFGLAAVALGGKIYALGGSGPTGAVEVYDPATDAWTPRAPLPTPRVFLAAAALGQKIYAVGGSPDCCGGAASAVVEVYDPATDSWTRAAPQPRAQQVSAAAAIGGKLYTFGGFIPGTGAVADTYEYDPATDRWTARTPLPQPPSDQNAAGVLGGEIHVVGGSTDCHCQALARHDRYCPGPGPCLPVPPGEADLAVEINDGVEEVQPCLPVAYEVVVSNAGPAAVAGAAVRADLPPTVTAVEWSCTPSAGATCTAPAAGGTLHDAIDLPALATVTYRATGIVDVGAPAAHVASATVAPPPGITEPNPTNDADEDRDQVGQAQADFRLRKDDGRTAVSPGDAVTYLIEVTNAGPCPATARVLDPFPPELSGVTWTCSGPPGACCTAGGSGRIRTCVSLEARASASISATGTVEAPGECPLSPCPPASATLSNTARVKALGGPCPTPRILEVCDPTAVNDGATDVDAIHPVAPAQADLAIVKATALGGTVFLAGGKIHYVLAVRNLGPDAVAGALVLDEPPAAVEGVAWGCGGPPGITCEPASGADRVEARVSLPAGGEAAFSVTGSLRPDFLGSLLNAATVTAPAGVEDPNPANDRSEFVVTVFRPGPGFAAAKTVVAYAPGDATVTYRIELLNPGPLAQPDNPGSEFVDALPRSLTLLAATASSGTLTLSGDTVVWDGEIPALGQVVITITARIEPGFRPEDLCNRGKLFADPDGEGVNDDVGATDDPSLPGEGDPTCLRGLSVLDVPALSAPALLLLALGLAGVGARRLAGKARRG